MDLKVKWTPKALDSYHSILKYLNTSWSEKEVKNFVNRTDSVVNIITVQPYLYKAAKTNTIRAAFVTKHNMLFYRIFKNKVVLLEFWDTRQNPMKRNF